MRDNVKLPEAYADAVGTPTMPYRSTENSHPSPSSPLAAASRGMRIPPSPASRGGCVFHIDA
jgi:hypothetical protein